MSNIPDNGRLLDDVFAEGADPDLREALLDETLHMARRRRMFRSARKAAAALALAALCGIPAQHYLSKHQFLEHPASGPYAVVNTRSSPDVAIVGTLPLRTDRLVSSVEHLALPVTTTRGWRAIDDEELLALVAPRPAVLFRRGANSEELVFLDPTGRGEAGLN